MVHESLFMMFTHVGIYHNMSGEILKLPLEPLVLKKYSDEYLEIAQINKIWFDTQLPQFRTVQEDFFEGQPLTHFVGYKKETKKQTEAIPNEILEKVCNKILSIIDYFYEKELSFDNILNQNLITKKDIKWSKNTIHSNKRYVFNVLNGIGYFVIGLYTGMRVSELMSLTKNSLEIDENGVLILNSTLFKLTQNDKGRPEKWGCGLNNKNNYALKVFKILSSLTQENHNSLFFRYENGEIQDFPLGSMNLQLKELMDFC